MEISDSKDTKGLAEFSPVEFYFDAQSGKHWVSLAVKIKKAIEEQLGKPSNFSSRQTSCRRIKNLDLISPSVESTIKDSFNSTKFGQLVL